jgi:hypothetical protein
MTSTPSPAEHLSAENLAREALQRIAEMNPRESASYLLPAWRKAKGIARAAIVAMDAARSPAPEQPKAGEREEVAEAVELLRAGASTDCELMDVAPRDGTWILAKYPDGSEHRVQWGLCDRGWSVMGVYDWVMGPEGEHPVSWRPS